MTIAARFAGALDRLVRSADRLADPLAFSAVVVGYYAVAYLVRSFVLSGSTGDEAQLLLYAQTFALGYDIVNLPLTGWLGALVESATGPGLGVALVVRYGLLAALFVVGHWAARAAIDDRRLALAVAIAPVGFYFVGWESLRNYTDSLSLVVALMATVGVVLRLARAPSTAGHLALAAVMAAGMLAKYNYLPALLALAAAGWATPAIRPAFADRRFLIGLVAAVAVSVPAYVWALVQSGGFLDAAALRLVQSAGNRPEAAFVDRLLAAPDSALSFALPMLPIFVLVFAADYWGGLRARAPIANAAVARWLGLYLALVLAGTALLAVAAGMERVREHYMFVLLPLPLFLAALLPRDRVDPRRIGLFVGINALLASVALLALAAQVVEVRNCDKCRLVMPWRAYAEQLRAAGFERGTIISLDSPFADFGPNLRRFLPETRVWSTKRPYVEAPPLVEPGDCLVVWSHARDADALERLRAEPVPRLGAPLPAEARAGVVTAPMTWSERPAPAMGYALIEAGSGDCR